MADNAKDMMAASDMTTPEAIAKMMEAWNKIEAQAKKQFPNASREELYRITKSAMQSALQSKFSRPGTPARFAVEDRFYFGKGRKERFELSFNRSEVERAKSELQSLVQVHRRLADKSEGVKAAKHGVVADVLARLINQGPEVLAAVGFRKASYWNARALELANASSSGYGPILRTLISEAEREYRSH